MVEPAKPRSKRGWFRRLIRITAWLLLALILFHRPLVHYGGPLVGRYFASRQNLDARFKLSGTIFTNLRVKDIRVVPNGRGPTPVEKIQIGELRFDYSLVKLMRDGVGEFMHSYEVHQAELAFVALPSKTKAERQQKFTIAQRLNDILARPAAYANRVLVDDFTVRVRSPEDETIIGPVDLSLDPTKPGFLRIGRLQVPGVPVWDNLSAVTTYVNRNLFIKDLALAPQIVIDRLNFDASERAQNRGKLAITARLFGGQLALAVTGQELEKKGENLEKGYATSLQISAAGLDVPAAATYFGIARPPVGTLTRFELKFDGEPEKPRTWDGSLEAEVAELSAGSLAIQPVEFGARFRDGRGSVRAGALIGSNRLELIAKVGLPSSVNEFADCEIEATVAVAAPKIEEIGARFTPPLEMQGDVSMNGTVTMRERRAGLDLKVALNKASFGKHAAERAQINLRGSKLLVRDAPALVGLTADIDARLQSVRIGTITLDSARVATTVREKQIQVEALEIIRGENSVVARGEYEAPADFAQFGKAPSRAEFTIHVPRLAEFGLGAGGRILSGKIEGGGELRTANGLAAGSLSIDGSNFEFGRARAERLLAKVTVVDQKAIIEQLVLRLQEKDQIAITGTAGIEAPFGYDGSVDIAVRDLATLQTALESFGVKEKVAGSIALRVIGKGQIQPGQHSGDATLRVDRARYGELEVRELRLAGRYSPQLAESRELHIVSGQTSIDGAIEWREGKLRLHDLDLRQAGQQALTGFVIVPFDPEHPERIIPFDQRLAVNVNATDLDVGKLAASFGKKSPVSGTFDWKLVAGGTIATPVLHLDVAARGLKATAAPQYDPADVELRLIYAEKKLSLDASAKQPLVQPLKIVGHVPLDLDALVHKKKLDPNMPLEGSLIMPPSSLAVLPKVVPAVRRIDGTAALDVRVSGTVGKPAFSGKAAIRLKEARMVAPNIPTIGGFVADLVFVNHTLTLETFRGEVGGGSFGLTGRINLAQLRDPVFDVALKADDVLAMRDDTITLRTDADLKFAGPLKAAAASGTVWITQSRFFKEIDILPIGLPGRPKPAPKSAPRNTTVSFPNPPLRDLKFDIAIKTRENDPFLIRGNLANGGVNVALQLGGTGLAPWLDGTITFHEFIASLPFSTLTISRGFVHFKKDEPFQPTLDLQAESKVRDYTVGAYIYGRASDPQVQFTSEPPLPHADIVSLLATGTTTAEMAGGADVLASRAAMLAIQSLYQKMFKKGQKTAPPLGGPKKDPGGASWLDRFQVEMGMFDSRTGGRAATARFKINEQMFLLGELDTQGRYTGSFKYLLRFR